MTQQNSTSGFYLISVEGGTEPETYGPYSSNEERDESAKKIRQDQSEEDSLFWLDIEDGVPTTGAFMAGFLQDDE